MTAELVAVSVIGTDRPGIVAEVTRALFEQGCNLEDATSTILRGHFSMVLIVRLGENPDVPALDRALRSAGESLGLVTVVRPVDEVRSDRDPPTHMISIYGADRPGIVYRASRRLAEAGANITDLTSRVIGGAGDPVYALMMEVALPQDLDAEELCDGLRRELNVEASVHEIDADVL